MGAVIRPILEVIGIISIPFIGIIFESFNFRHEAVIEFVDDSPKEHNIPRRMIFIAKDDVPNGINYSN